jgi:hypothetical protein
MQPDIIKRRGSELGKVISPTAGFLNYQNKENIQNLDASDGRQTTASILGFSSSLSKVR